MFKILLRKKIAFLFAFFGLLPLIVTAFLTITQIQNSLKETVSENLVSLADEVMSSVEKTAKNIHINIELLATNPLIKSRETSDEEKLSEMNKIQDFYRIFEDITLIDLDGNVIISTTYNYRGEWNTKQWYQEAKEGKTSISPVHIILSPFKIILSSATPVIDKKGEIIAVVAGQLNMEKIWEITNDVKIGKKGFAFMVNREGRFIAHPDKEKILSTVPYSYFVEKISSKDSGIINYTDENKEEMVCGFASLSDPLLIEQGWKLIVTQPESEVFALVNIFQKQVIAIFLTGLVLLLIISYSLSSNIVTPVRKLIGATKKVAAGKLETKIEVKTGDEIEELAESFNRMTEDLRKSRIALEEAKTNLEIKVKERTKELEEAKSVLEIKVQARTKALKELAESLERQVQERTKELQDRIDELEKFRKLTVGRELKMIELKEEIKKLKGELKRSK